MAVTLRNIAELRARAGSVGAEVTILGSVNTGDGGSAAYYWDATSTEPDNGFTVLQKSGLTPGRWKIKVDQRLVATCSNGTSGDANMWTKVATINFGTTQNVDFNLSLSFVSRDARLQNVTVIFTGRQTTTGNAPIYMYVDVLPISTGSTFDYNCFKITSGGFGTDFTIYVKKINAFGQIRVFENMRNVPTTATLTYFNNQGWIAEPTATYENKSYGGIMSPDQSSVIDLISPFTGNTYQVSKATSTPVGGIAITDALVDGVYFHKINGAYYTRVGVINLRDCGAGRGSTFNDTTLIQKACTYFPVVYAPAGQYYVRDLVLPRAIEFYGCGYGTRFKFFSSSDTQADATNSYTIISDGAYSKIHDFLIDNNATPSNGFLVKPSANDGIKREIYGIFINNITGYVPNPGTNGWGTTGNINRTNLTSVIGGNGFVVEDSSVAAWELDAHNIIITRCDGVGMDLGRITDSIVNSVWIGTCIKQGLLMNKNNANNTLDKFKVYLCRAVDRMQLTFAESIYKITPYSLSLAGDVGSVELVGPNHKISNFEIQECGSHGLQLGNTTFCFRNSTITNLLVDGNGGFDSTQDATTQAAYRRYGVLFVNYWMIDINGKATDFRAKVKAARQSKAFGFITPKPSTTNSLVNNNVYRIKSVGAGTDFTKIQYLANTNNTVGFAFEARKSFSDSFDIVGTFGTGGSLEAPNDYLNIDLQIDGQYDADWGLSVGYELGGIYSNGNIKINGVSVLSKDVSTDKKQISVKTANYTATLTDRTILVNATSGNLIITLPTAASAYSATLGGYTFIIKKIDNSANTVTIKGNGAETIDGVNTQVISAQWMSYQVQSNGTSWYIV